MVTERELAVLGLVDGHLTNAEIAEQLVLSVRTVESHVSSLIRKLGVSDRRGLARRAEELGLLRRQDLRRWPSPADDFIGREAETADLSALLRDHRVVTVAGPGGVGKTRLTVHAVGLVAQDRGDGAWFVDLSQVTHAEQAVPAIAGAVGAAEQPGRSLTDSLVDALRGADGVLVLDNCEHLLPSLEPHVARLVADCPELSVVATSRAPLRAPYEWVYELPPLIADDAVRLFRSRAEAAGGVVPDGPEVERLCERLEGMALAVELTAARYPVLGLDGLAAALEDPLRLLGGEGSKQRSLRATIAWSVDLLDAEARELFRSVWVFAAPFTAAAAHAVALPDRTLAEAARALATLADQHLLRVRPGSPTRYSLQEVVRQYAEHVGEGPDLLAGRHEEWVRAELARLEPAPAEVGWRTSFDDLAIEVRAALARSPEGQGLGDLFAEQLLLRGRLEEAQRRFETTAAQTSDPGGRIELLRRAAGAAAARLVGDELVRLLDETAEAAATAADPATRADALAWSVIYAAFHPGIMAHPLPRDEIDRRLAEARSAVPPRSSAVATVAAATASCLPGDHPEAVATGRRAADEAVAAGLPLVASAALDCVCAGLLRTGEHAAALAAVRQRGELMDPLPLDALTAYPFNDYLLMGCEVSLAAGVLAEARTYAERLAELPCYLDYPHPALARHLQVDLLTGDLAGAVAHGEQFLASWDRAGRHRATTLAVAACAVATVHGILGDERRRSEWNAVTRQLLGEPLAPGYSPDVGWAPTLDAVLLLHQRRPEEALARLAPDLDDPRWATNTTALLWRPWYAAAWAEATALARPADLGEHLDTARAATGQNAVAAGLVDRAEALARDAHDEVAAFAQTFEDLGAGYQRDRSVVLGRDGPRSV